MNKKLVFVLYLAGCLPILRVTVQAQQSNFLLMPAPIAYPHFEPGRKDLKVAGDYFTFSGNEIDMKGGGTHGIFRYAANEIIAIDGIFGIYGVGGEVPGFALPFFFSSGFFTPIIDGKADVSGFGFPMAINLEIQAINRPAGSLILFGGPNLAFGSFTLRTPYHAVSGGTVAGRTTFETQASVVMGGVQGGVQAGIRLGNFRLVPFAMGMTMSGSASFTFDNGYKNTLSIEESGAVEIEPFFVSAYGADIIYEPWDLSLGAMFQNNQTEKNQLGYDISYFTLAWHFRTN